MSVMKTAVRVLYRLHGRNAFLVKMYLKYFNASKSVRVLDVGCGNNSVRGVKDNFPDCYYIGIDVGDYNLEPECKEMMEEYHVVKPEEFPDKIFAFRDSVDIVISNHNIEHCNEPDRVLKAMGMALRKDGNIYMAFPSEESVNFPHRGGTLNFYDDSSHQNVPDWNAILSILENCGISIMFKRKKYQPLLDRLWGGVNERKSIKDNRVLRGTWAYYGFESVIWGKRYMKSAYRNEKIDMLRGIAIILVMVGHGIDLLIERSVMTSIWGGLTMLFIHSTCRCFF